MRLIYTHKRVENPHPYFRIEYNMIFEFSISTQTKLKKYYLFVIFDRLTNNID